MLNVKKCISLVNYRKIPPGKILRFSSFMRKHDLMELCERLFIFYEKGGGWWDLGKGGGALETNWLERGGGSRKKRKERRGGGSNEKIRLKIG